MGRSQGRGTTVALLAASGYLLSSQFSAFVGQSASSGRTLRVSLAASQADVETAEKEFRLKSWAAAHLAGEGSPQAAAAAMRAQQAEAAYMAVKAQFDGQAAPVAPVVAAPVAVAPMPAAPAATSAVSKEELVAAKASAQLLTWSANKLMSEGAPQAAAMKAKADQAVAAFEAMKQAEASGVAAAPVAAAPAVVAAAAPVASAVSKEELAAAKSNAQLLSWAANKLMSEGAPQAAAMKSKADQAVAAFEAMKQAEATGGAAPAAPAAPVAAAPVAPAPVAAAPVVSSAPSAEEVLKAKKEMELHEWAAEKLASSGSLQAAVMKAKAEQSRQAYEALVAAQDKQLVAR